MAPRIDTELLRLRIRDKIRLMELERLRKAQEASSGDRPEPDDGFELQVPISDPLKSS